jgi:aryl-alcohol dehydrogenase-like predicted oxidoreductase
LTKQNNYAIKRNLTMKLGLGTVQFGLPYGIANKTGQIQRHEAKAMLQLAAEAGVDTLDTAIAYGESETCLGEAGVQRFKLVTKLPSVPDDCADVSGWVQEQFAASLARLGVTNVNALLLHRPEQLLSSNGKAIYQALRDLQDKGQVQKLGVSIYAPSELDAISKLFRIKLVQAPFNLVDRRLQTSGWMQRLKDENIEIHTRSVFLQGLLLMPHAALLPKFAPWNKLWERWQKWLLDHDVSAVQACLAFPHAFPAIDRIVVGADSRDQLAQIIEAASSTRPLDLPNLQSDDETLITPSHWPKL